jgi:hypothetical protein
MQYSLGSVEQSSLLTESNSGLKGPPCSECGTAFHVARVSISYYSLSHYYHYIGTTHVHGSTDRCIHCSLTTFLTLPLPCSLAM